MTGEQLKERLTTTGRPMAQIARLIGTSRENFAATLKVADVKTGVLEKLCDVLNVKMNFFYEGTNYVDTIQADDANPSVGNSQFEDMMRRMAREEAAKLMNVG